MSDVDVPAVGRVDQRWLVVGGTAVAVIVGVAWWRHRQAASAVPVVDPTTGSTSTDPTYHNPNPVTSGAGSDAQLPPANDQEWTARVMASLSWFEPGYLGNILGKYLGRQGLSLEEAAVVRVAWATDGKPPSNTPIILSTDTSTPGGGTTNPPPPPPVGKLPAPGGFHATPGKFAVNRDGSIDTTTNYIDAAWAAVSGAVAYVYHEESAFGSQTHEVTGTWIHETGLSKPDTDHHLSVRAKDKDGNLGDPAQITVHTPIFRK